VLNALHDSIGHGYHGQMANMKPKSAHCVVLGNAVYVCALILTILRQTLLSLSIPIKYDVLNVLHDGIGRDIFHKWVIYGQNLHVPLAGFYQSQ
jgi:hypothetical protein